MYHIFIYSPVNGHLGYFHVLAIVNSVLWTKRGMYLYGLQFCLDICPRVGLLDHMKTLFLVFWGTSILFSIVAAPICIPSNSVGSETYFVKAINYAFPSLYPCCLGWMPYCLKWGGHEYYWLNRWIIVVKELFIY